MDVIDYTVPVEELVSAVNPLVLKTGTVELIFGVTDEGTIAVGVEGELSDEVTNTLKIELLRA